MKSSENEHFLLKTASRAQNAISHKVASSDRQSAFLSAFSEYHSIVERACSEEKDGNDELIRLVGLHERWTKLIVEHLGVDISHPLNSAPLSKFRKTFGHIVASLGNVPSDERIISVADQVDRVVEDGNQMRELLQGALAGEVSEDVLVSVKLACMPASFEFDATLKACNISDKDRSKLLGQQISVAVELSKDIAYNYDKAGSVWDRERLFVGSLPYCLSIVEKAWLDLYSQSLPEPLLSIQPGYLSGKLIETRSAIESLDMGYDEVNYSRRVLLEQIAAVLSEYLTSRFNETPNSLGQRIMAYWLSVYDPILSECWNEAGGLLMDRVSNMTEVELAEFMNGEGRRPMTLDEFWLLFERKIGQLENSINFCPTLPELMHNSGRLLVSLWGLSDTICKVRGVKAG